jgi:hypothetical protein
MNFLIEPVQIPDEEKEKRISERFGSNIVPVAVPWRSCGAFMQIGDWVYFKGNAADPNDPCGNDSLCMKVRVLYMTPPCPVDGAASYYLIPDTD